MRHNTTNPRPTPAPAAAVGALLLGLLAWSGAAADVVDFRDLTLGPQSHWEGPDPAGADRVVTEWWGSYTQRVGSFQSGGAVFSNKFNLDFGTWSDWAYSNTTNNVTLDYVDFGGYVLPTNQSSAFAGGGLDGPGDSYGVAYGYTALADYGPDDVPHVVLPDGVNVAGAYFTNNTYPALIMRDGDVNNFAKKFGGPSGNDADWFKLTVRGLDAAGNLLPAEVPFLLADYTSADNAQDYIVDNWTWVDLSALAGAKTLLFNLSSSDAGVLGMNTPAFFAMDNLTWTGGSASAVPEPSSLVLAAAGAAALGGLRLSRRRRRSTPAAR